ncbi:hypothetical protein V6N13_015876 [Hibiscus sabdariffa]|uniref:Uncharacterized protein n=1 Tax=Hibiscus sabdariffa TaxID=183260 RepID=A0ABR2CYN3_9ROSI
MKGSEKKSSFSSPAIKSSVSTDRSYENFSRKKVLGERNESPGSNSTITHFSKSPSLDSKPSPEIISKASQKNSPNPESDPKVTSKDHYDPLKNYLSPRPQFLRYDPDRRREIFLRLGMEDKEGDDSTSESDDEADTVSSDNSSLASSSSQEDEEFRDGCESLFEEEDEEFDSEREEEIQEERAWSFRGVLKYFLLSVVLLLSTSYISSMNSPVSAPAFEGPALCFQNHSIGIAEGFEIGYKFLDAKQEQLGLLSFTQTMADEVIEEEMTENANMGHIAILELEDTIVEPEEIVEGELMEDGDGEGEHVTEDESVKIEWQEVQETGEQIEETRDVIEDKMVGDIEQQGQQTDEEIEFLQVDHQASLLSEGTESLEETREVPMEADEDIHKETSDITDMVQVLIMRTRSAGSVLEKWGKSIALKFQEMDQLKGLNQHMGTEMFPKVVFGILAFAAIVASFVFGSNIRRKGIAPQQDKHSSSTEPVVKEKPSLLSLPVERDEPKKLAISNTVPLTTTTSAKESRAPSVELLAEFEIGGISRSLKSSAINSRMKDEASYSYFSEKEFASKDQQVFSAVNSSSSERCASTAKKPSGLSAMNSSSTSTAKKKGLGKELGSTDEVITPLRRSARIRKRADVVSP